METLSKWILTDEEKMSFIDSITPNLAVLRTQANISQDELSNLVGISRQTYSAIERKTRKMSWNTYLSLVLFFDHNQKTHRLMRKLSLFPTELVVRFNEGIDYSSFELSEILGDQAEEVLGHLDSRAIDTIKDTVLSEYARCTNKEEYHNVKSFNGNNADNTSISSRDIEVIKAIRAIVDGNYKDEQ